MMTLRKSNERGYFENGWLKSFHSFSFGEYYDRKHMHFRDLRVINHDFIAPSMGFGTHPHRDMEILTYVLRGQVQHQDSMGNKTFIKAGEVQVMSAGTGITHSEFNPDPNETLELLQIWVLPSEDGLKPSYDQRKFTNDEKKNQLRLIASPTAEKDSLRIHQNVKVYGSLLEAGQTLKYPIPPHRAVWLQIAKGKLDVNGQTLSTGDGISVDADSEKELVMRAGEETDLILFDL